VLLGCLGFIGILSIELVRGFSPTKLEGLTDYLGTWHKLFYFKTPTKVGH